MKMSCCLTTFRTALTFSGRRNRNSSAIAIIFYQHPKGCAGEVIPISLALGESAWLLLLTWYVFSYPWRWACQGASRLFVNDWSCSEIVEVVAAQ